MIVKPSSIKPKVRGVSDKFSSRLYNFVKKNGSWGNSAFRVTWPNDKDRHEIYIGHCDKYFLTGARLNSIVCGMPKIWANILQEGTIVEDISEEFWAEYLRIGVCSIHDSGHIWVGSKTKRTCETCEKTEVLRTKVVKRKVWVSPQPMMAQA